jgi:hypothetical protein
MRVLERSSLLRVAGQTRDTSGPENVRSLSGPEEHGV